MEPRASRATWAEDRWLAQFSDPVEVALERDAISGCRYFGWPMPWVVAREYHVLRHSPRLSPGPSGNVDVSNLRRRAEALCRPDWRLRTPEDNRSVDAAETARPCVARMEVCQVQATLAGWLSTLSPKTREQYEKKASKLGLPAHLEGTHDPIGLACAVQERCERVQRSSLRLYRSVATHRIACWLIEAGHAYLPEVFGAYLLADAVFTDAGRLPTQTPWTEARACFPDEDRFAICDRLRSSRSGRAKRLVDLINALLMTGMRPREVRTAKAEIREDRLILTVQNGKHDEDGQRTHGPERTLTFVDLHGDHRCSLLNTIRCAQAFDEEAWDEELAAFQRLLRDTCNAQWKGSRRYRLYSCRQQFAADAKLHYASEPNGLVMVAALMGHATDATATVHYAPAKSGRRGVKMAQAADQEVLRVRRVQGSKLAEMLEKKHAISGANASSMIPEDLNDGVGFKAGMNPASSIGASKEAEELLAFDDMPTPQHVAPLQSSDPNLWPRYRAEIEKSHPIRLGQAVRTLTTPAETGSWKTK
jgi:hypothetical protein